MLNKRIINPRRYDKSSLTIEHLEGDHWELYCWRKCMVSLDRREPDAENSKP